MTSENWHKQAVYTTALPEKHKALLSLELMHNIEDRIWVLQIRLLPVLVLQIAPINPQYVFIQYITKFAINAFGRNE